MEVNYRVAEIEGKEKHILGYTVTREEAIDLRARIIGREFDSSFRLSDKDKIVYCTKYFHKEWVIECLNPVKENTRLFFLNEIDERVAKARGISRDRDANVKLIEKLIREAILIAELKLKWEENM